jgi:hypothetical protein
MDRICRIRKGNFIPQAREHEGSEVKPGSAGRLTGFRDFAFGDQRLTVGSRPASRRWRVRETIFCLQSRDCGTDFSVLPRDVSMVIVFKVPAQPVKFNVGYWIFFPGCLF